MTYIHGREKDNVQQSKECGEDPTAQLVDGDNVRSFHIRRLGRTACPWLGEAVQLSDREVSGSGTEQPEASGYLARQNRGS